MEDTSGLNTFDKINTPKYEVEIDAIFTVFDDMLLKKKFRSCDNLMKYFSIEKTPIEILVCVLTITHNYDKYLWYRGVFKKKVRQKIIRKTSESEANEILKGL